MGAGLRNAVTSTLSVYYISKFIPKNFVCRLSTIYQININICCCKKFSQYLKPNFFCQSCIQILAFDWRAVHIWYQEWDKVQSHLMLSTFEIASDVSLLEVVLNTNWWVENLWTKLFFLRRKKHSVQMWRRNLAEENTQCFQKYIYEIPKMYTSLCPI